MKILVLLLVTIYTVSVAQGAGIGGDPCPSWMDCASGFCQKVEGYLACVEDFEGYDKKPNHWCKPYQIMTATTLSDATKECSINARCYMFYDDYGTGNTFFSCGNTASIKKSTVGSILYQNHECDHDSHCRWYEVCIDGNCEDDNGCFDVKLTTVSYGSEISWSLGSCQGNGGYGNNGEYTEQCCLEPGNYNLECKDSYGDGWHGGYIEVNGKKYCESFSSGSEKNIQIIIEAKTCTDTPSWSGGYGLTCEDFRTEYCRDNSAGYMAGAKYRYPEKNCCLCGKGKA